MISTNTIKTLSNSKMRRKHAYVRVPTQICNRVLVLNTNVNSDRITSMFTRALSDLKTLAILDPIYHISINTWCIRWLDFYDKYTAAFRALNGSRTLRNLHVSGFRLINFEKTINKYDVRSDVYVCGTECMCVLLDLLARALLPSGSINIALHLSCTHERAVRHRSAILNSPNWRRCPLTLSTTTRSQATLKFTCALDKLCESIGLVTSIVGEDFCGLSVQMFGLSVDLDTSLNIEERHTYNDPSITLSGYRLRRFQRFGRIAKF